MVPFAGWNMPVQYSGILAEVRMVRASAGLFDLGHMGRVRISGAGAEPFLQKLQTNDVSQIRPGRIRYGMILDEDGHVLDDILVYREPADEGFFTVVNAGNTERDLAVMHETAKGFADVRIQDQTEDLGMIAIQGPASQEIAQKVCGMDLSLLKYYAWAKGDICGCEMAISRTGYTGEDGFEIYAPNELTGQVWDALLGAGEPLGLGPVGLGARDTLRLEAGMALYGHEIDGQTNPLEAGLGWAVKFTHDFTGRPALEKLRDDGGTGRKLIGLTTSSRRVPRQGYTLWDGDREIGTVCSGGASPTLEINIATGYVPDQYSDPGTSISFAVRDKREPAQVVSLPFYKRNP
jgi:aminomethyltransferase